MFFGPVFPLLLAAVLPLTPTDLPEVAALIKGQPKDVVNFVRRLEICHHWGGEEPYDKARAAEIAAAWNRNKCPGLDKEEARLRKKYKRKPKVIQALDQARANFQ